jgi:HD superfamily phosphodiesterase
MRCPGQDMRYWKPGDIFEAQCPKCGKKIEFFKDEVRRRCSCGHTIVNPKFDFGCAQWCPHAEQCVGVLPDEVKAKQKAEQKELLRERIGLEMKKYFGTDFKHVGHALKVARYAEKILKMEGGNPLVVLGAAYLHDLGAKDGGKKPGSSGVDRGQEGAAAAQKILKNLDVDKEVIDEVCNMIARQDHPAPEETLNFQILREADCLVKLEEEDISGTRETMEKRIKEIFRTVTGRQLAEDLSLSRLSNQG